MRGRLERGGIPLGGLEIGIVLTLPPLHAVELAGHRCLERGRGRLKLKLLPHRIINDLGSRSKDRIFPDVRDYVGLRARHRTARDA